MIEANQVRVTKKIKAKATRNSQNNVDNEKIDLEIDAALVPENIVLSKDKKDNKNDEKRKERPGRLRSEVALYLNTADSQMVFVGAQQDAIGLLQFGGRMSEIWNAAAKDDPYADLYLLRVYDMIIKLRNQLAVLIQDYEQQLSQSSMNQSMKLQPFVSEKPIIKFLWFRTQYGYLGANLVADFDRLIRIVLTANRIGILLPKSHENIRKEWMEKIFIVLKMPFKWEDTGIKRMDVVAKNELAKKAQQVMGKLPECILNKKIRSPFAPYINELNELNDVSVSPSQPT